MLAEAVRRLFLVAFREKFGIMIHMFLHVLFINERPVRIELTSSGWKPEALPLSYGGIVLVYKGFFPSDALSLMYRVLWISTASPDTGNFRQEAFTYSLNCQRALTTSEYSLGGKYPTTRIGIC